MVIITLPASNEEAALPPASRRVKEAMEEQGFEYRVIAVDDGNSDLTEMVDALKPELPLERIDHPPQPRARRGRAQRAPARARAPTIAT